MTRFGDFTLEAEIGDGAASRVWSAVHEPSKSRVAIKFFNQLSKRSTTEHLFREIRLVAQASHPRIVKVFGYGQSTSQTVMPDGTTCPKGQVYLVMEMVERGTLKPLLGQTTWQETRQILLDILSGLARVHARGIVHLDLKPGNVLMAERGAVLSDFGIALATQQNVASLARNSGSEASKLAIVGTPHFMAPEQCVSAANLYGPWTDLYAVGCIAHSLVTGKPPYREKEVVDVLIAHRKKTIPRLEDNYLVPVGFDQWLEKLLAKPWQQRYLWAQDARADLLRLGRPSGQARSAPSISSWTEPTMLSNEGVSDETMIDLIVMRDEARTGVIPLASEQPRVQSEWAEEFIDLGGASPLSGFGLELIQFETAHIVGRLEERRLLWRNFAFAAQKRRVSTTVLRGRPGTGKSVLAEWLCTTTHETGVGHYLQIRHSRDARSESGILTALRIYFGIREKVDLLETIAERLGLPQDDILCQTLRTLLADADASTGFDKAVISHQERQHLLCRLLIHISELRTLIVHVDDAQWGFGSLRLLSTLISMQPRARIHFLITVNNDELDDDSIATKELGSILAGRYIRMVELGPMSTEDCASFVASKAKMSADEVSELVKLSEGNPLFVREFLLSRLSVDLRRENSGATSMKKLWRLRVEQWLPTAPEGTVLALQCAAVLGSTVVPAELTELFQTAGGEQDISRIISSGIESGFLNLEQDESFSFVHGVFRNAVLEIANESNLRESLSRMAGEMLERHHSKDHVRLANYYQQGGAAEAASRHWGFAVEHFRQVDDYPLIRWALTQWTVVMRERHVHFNDPQWWKLVMYWAATDRQQGHVDKALKRITRLKKRIEGIDSESPMLVSVGLNLANCRQRVFGPGSIQAELNETLELAERVAPELVVEVLVTIAKDLKLSGKYGEAEKLYREALDRLGESEEHIRLRAGSHVRVGDCLSRRERYEEALIEVKKGVKLARRSNSPHLLGDVLNLYGEVLRTSGYLEQAESAYREAAELMMNIGSVTRFIVQANLAIVLQLRGDFAQSRRIVEALLRQRRGHSFQREQMAFNALLLPSLVVDDDFERFDRTIRDLEATYALDWGEFDIGQAAYRAATKLQNKGEVERAVRTFKLVEDQYRKLGLKEPLSQVRQIINDLVAGENGIE